MKTWKTIPRIDEPVTVTVGNFDGLHIGHQALLARVLALSRPGGRRVVVSFGRHTRAVLSEEPGLLLAQKDKTALLCAAGMDDLVLLPFDDRMAATPAEDFIAALCEKMRVRTLVVGYDFRFGRGGLGDLALLLRLGSQRGFAVSAVEPVMVEEQPVSSSRIREAIRAGQMEQARRLLGRWYAMPGRVSRGDRIGGRIGFPTANLTLPEPMVIPAGGVYASWVLYRGRRYPAMTNIGFRPTVTGADPELRIESHLLDAQLQMYGRPMTLVPLERFRAEQAFDGLDALRAQLTRDREYTRDLIALKKDLF